MTTEKQRAPRTPRNFESISKGALALGLQERSDLIKLLKKSVDDEVADLKLKAEQAAKIINGGA